MLPRKLEERSLLIHTTDSGAGWLADNADALSKGFIFPKLSRELGFGACQQGGDVFSG